MNELTQESPRYVGLARRLLCMFYDTLLLIAIWMVAVLIVELLAGHRFDGPAMTFYLTLVTFAFIGWFWVNGGQTLGMKTWQVRVVTDAGGPLDWKRAAQRFAWAAVSLSIFGIGFLWALFDEKSRTLHDILSHTHLERV
ncbi:MAG: RDD family protein [Gammaproteobacteria bacterium]|jgi:uncharacterized RDD family membrane protein YckC